MPAWKLDLIFECRGRGWEETYYADFGVPSFDDMTTIAQALADKRIVLAAPPVVIKAYRVSDPLSVGRQGKAFYYKPAATAPTNSLWLEGAIEPSAAVNIGFSKNVTNQTRRIQMRGCPDPIMTNFGQLGGPAYAAWQTLWEAWRLFMLGTPRFGWLTRSPVADPAPVSYSLVPNPVLPIFTTVADFFPLADVNKVRMVRLRGFNNSSSAANGEMIVRVLTRDTFTPMKALAVGPMLTPGIVQRYGDPTFITADNCIIEKGGRRAPGAPLLETPGRSRGRPRT